MSLTVMNLYDMVGVEHGGCRSDESPAYIRSEEHRVDAGALRLYQVSYFCQLIFLIEGFALPASNNSNKFCPVLVCQELSLVFSRRGVQFFSTCFCHNAFTEVQSVTLAE